MDQGYFIWFSITLTISNHCHAFEFSPVAHPAMQAWSTAQPQGGLPLRALPIGATISRRDSSLSGLQLGTLSCGPLDRTGAIDGAVVHFTGLLSRRTRTRAMVYSPMGAWPAAHSDQNRGHARSISSMGLRLGGGCGYRTSWAWRSPSVCMDEGPMGPPRTSQSDDAPVYDARSSHDRHAPLYVGALCAAVVAA